MDDHNLFFTGYQKKIKKMLKFEVISFIGRIFSPKIRLSKNKYIQIGCGSNFVSGFEYNCESHFQSEFELSLSSSLFRVNLGIHCLKHT